METGTEVILSALPQLFCDFRACGFILMELNTFIYKIMNWHKLTFKVPFHFIIPIPSLAQDHISLEFITSTFASSCIRELCACSVMSNSLYAMDCSLSGSLFMEFSRQEYWSGLPCIFLTPRVFMTQGLHQYLLHFLHCRWILYH